MTPATPPGASPAASTAPARQTRPGNSAAPGGSGTAPASPAAPGSAGWPDAMPPEGFDLPAGLLLGSATAPTQIEGGDTNCNWYAWSLAGRVGQGESSLGGADHWKRWREDVELLAGLGQQCYRMGLEWSRLEPRPGEWSADGLAHYREEIGLLRQRGIVPLVTLHHFSCPQWFQERGGWLAPDAVDCFLRYVTYAVSQLGDLVAEWCTINEPNVFANDSYMDGKYPPGGQGDIGAYFKVARNLILAHLRAYRAIHRIRQEQGHAATQPTRVGFAHHLAVFEPAGRHPLARLGCALQDYLFHTIFFRGFVEGRLVFPLGHGQPEGPGIFCDYLGINYYSRHLFRRSWNPAKLFATPGTDPTLPPEALNDLGWEIYPPGLYQVARRAWDRYHLPVWITENGIPDAADGQRSRFIAEHLWQLRRLAGEGVAVERYYHWSFLDNLEWNDGYGPRFGLVEVDYRTMDRHVRPSARYYAAICKSRRVSPPANPASQGVPHAPAD